MSKKTNSKRAAKSQIKAKHVKKKPIRKIDADPAAPRKAAPVKVGKRRWSDSDYLHHIAQLEKEVRTLRIHADHSMEATEKAMAKYVKTIQEQEQEIVSLQIALASSVDTTYHLKNSLISVSLTVSTTGHRGGEDG